jgi:UDP-N-acetylglucosamine 2-epimerase (non-hydrolysing)
MPEEINRIVTDRLASLLFTPSRDADDSLRKEGESADKIVFVGNVMIDSLLYALPQARSTGFVQQMALETKPIAVTIHRPSNVDHPERLSRIGRALAEIAETRPVVFPVHPRTKERLSRVRADLRKVRILPPIGYLEMLDLISAAHAVITDSGGIQEETTALGIPCLTLRENTERPITIREGTNQLVPEPEHLLSVLNSVRTTTNARRPEGWDGAAGERIIAALIARS